MAGWNSNVVYLPHDHEVPMRYDGPQSEYEAARHGCVVLPGAIRTLLTATGEDRTRFLHGMLSNDIANLQAGQGCPAAFLTDSGKVITDLRVYVEPKRILLDVARWRGETLRSALDRYIIADDVELGPRADTRPLAVLEGPHSRAVLDEITGGETPPVASFEHILCRIGDHEIGVAAVSELRLAGFILFGPPGAEEPLRARLIAAGAVPAGLQALDALRVERGVPWAGVDIDEDVLAMEVDLRHAISFTKGCYLGQEVVERVSARGHVNRAMVGLVFGAQDTPPVPCPVVAGEQEVGSLRSLSYSPTLQRPLGLAIVHTKRAAGAALAARDTAGRWECDPIDLPLWSE